MEIKKSNMKAFGLLESIIAIGVFGVTIVVGLSLIVKSLAIIKDNQVADQASAFVYSSLEYVRSPIVKPDTLTKGIFYKVNTGLQGQVTGITSTSSASEIEANSSCSSSSEFYIDIDGPDSNGTFCNQITVDYVNPLDPANSDYIIRSIGVYKIKDGYKLTESIGFKNRTQL